jgi:hypothetical protein
VGAKNGIAFGGSAIPMGCEQDCDLAEIRHETHYLQELNGV